jgi:hypothetical protein
MIHVINIPLTFYYDGEDITVDYSFNITENLQDVIEYLFEEEYNSKYMYHSWYLEEGAREFVQNLQTLWNNNSLDTWSLYTKDGKFTQWLMEKYYEEALNQYLHETSMEYGEAWDEDIKDLYEDEID